MLKNGELLKLLFQESYQLSPFRFTLHHFLRTFYSPDLEFSPFILDDFIRMALDYPHWQQNKESMTEETHALLQEFACFSEGDVIKWPSDYQVIELENVRDLLEVSELYLKRILPQQDPLRLIIEAQKRILGLHLNPQNEMTIYLFDNKFTTLQGYLVPLKTNHQLRFNSFLNLKEDVVQRFDLSPYITASFFLKSDSTSSQNPQSTSRIYGQLVRGYAFQNVQSFQGETLTQLPRLFYAVKRMEQFFVSRSTDPYYQDLIQNLEKQIQLVKMGVFIDSSDETSSDLILKVQNALEYVFIGDKVLDLLVKELQRLTESTDRMKESPLTWKQERSL